jgi:hypothetical protein
MPFAKQNAEPVYLAQMKALLKRHPKAAIIWAHIGLGRIVHPVQASQGLAERNPTQLEIVESMVSDPALSHVSFDISWDEVAKYAIASPESIARVSSMLNRHSDRFLFGTDTVAPTGPGPYFAVFDMWAPVWRVLTPEASLKVRKGNYERIFDEGRRRVRAWKPRTSADGLIHKGERHATTTDEPARRFGLASGSGDRAGRVLASLGARCGPEQRGGKKRHRSGKAGHEANLGDLRLRHARHRA